MKRHQRLTAQACFCIRYARDHSALRYVFILPTLASDHCAITSSLQSWRHMSITLRWGNLVQCLSQRHNKLTCWLVLYRVPLMQSVKQGSCEYQLRYLWFDPTRNQTQDRSFGGRRSYHSGELLLTWRVVHFAKTAFIFNEIHKNVCSPAIQSRKRPFHIIEHQQKYIL